MSKTKTIDKGLFRDSFLRLDVPPLEPEAKGDGSPLGLPNVMPKDQKLEAILNFFDHLPTGLLAINQDAEVIWLNEHACTALGLEHKALPFSRTQIFTPLQSQLSQLIEHQENRHNIQVKVELPRQEAACFKLRCMPDFTASVPAHISIISIEKCQPKEKLEAALLEAQHRERAQQQLLSSMSHEIHNSANVIAGLVQAIQENPGAIGHLQNLQYASDFLLNLTDNLLYYSKLKDKAMQLKKAAFELPQLLRALSQLPMLSLSKGKVRFEYYQDPRLPVQVCGDKTAIYQVVLNLLSNAIKYTNEGFVRLSVQLIKKENQQYWIGFKITDSGPGIPTPQLKTIFQPYFRGDAALDEQTKGAGLGLTIARQLTELLGGQLGAESVVGMGSTFRFQIPLDQVSAPELVRPAAKTIRLQAKSPLRLLILEDNPLCRAHLEHIIQQQGCAYHSCTNGREALEAFEEYQFDLALIDLRTPLLNGYEVIARLRSMQHNPNSNIPIVVTTGAYEQASKGTLAHLSVNECLNKPFDQEQLWHLIRKYTYAPLQTTTSVPDFQFSENFDNNLLQQLFHGRLDHLVPIFQAFLDTTPKSLNKMDQLHTSQNWKALADEAHKIKPAFSLVGIPNIGNLAKELESICRDAPLTANRVEQAFSDFYKNAKACLQLVQSEKGRLHSFMETNNAA